MPNHEFITHSSFSHNIDISTDLQLEWYLPDPIFEFMQSGSEFNIRSQMSDSWKKEERIDSDRAYEYWEM